MKKVLIFLVLGALLGTQSYSLSSDVLKVDFMKLGAVQYAQDGSDVVAAVIVDTITGCQYIMFNFNGKMMFTIRYNANGQPYCGKQN